MELKLILLSIKTPFNVSWNIDSCTLNKIGVPVEYTPNETGVLELVGEGDIISFRDVDNPLLLLSLSSKQSILPNEIRLTNGKTKRCLCFFKTDISKVDNEMKVNLYIYKENAESL